MISTLELTVLALVAATVLSLVFRRRLKYADSMVVRLEKLNQAVGDQSIYIRGLGRETLNLRRAQKSKIAIRDRFHEKCEEIRVLKVTSFPSPGTALTGNGKWGIASLSGPPIKNEPRTR